MDKFSLQLLFYPQSNGRYSVICPALNGCFSDGDTYEEAYKNIMDLINGQLKRMDSEDIKDLQEAYGMRDVVFRSVEVQINETRRTN